MKISRGTYPLLFALILFFLIRPTIEEFSKEIGRQINFPFLIVFVILIVIGFIIAIKDKELLKTITDERTKKVDRSAGYYSWWFTLFFVVVLGFIADIQNFTLYQFIIMIVTVMFLSMTLFHMYFNFKGEI